MRKRQRAPRLDAETKRQYLRKEELAEGEILALNGRTGRRAWVLGALQKALDDEPVQEYLIDAIWRWLLLAVNTDSALESYVASIRRWIVDSQRFGLAEQFATRPNDLLIWVQDQRDDQLSPRYIRKNLMVARSWFTWLEEREHIERAPITKAVRKAVKIDKKAIVKANGMRQALTPEEAQEVVTWCLRKAEPHVGLGVVLMLADGLRSAEVAGLELRRVTEHEGRTYLCVVGKGNKTRSLALGPVTIAALHRYLRHTGRQGRRGPLIRAPGGGHFTPRCIQRWAKKAAAVVGRENEISSHDLRKTCATLMMNRGAPIEHAQQQLGHSSPETTLDCYVVYGHEQTVTTGLEVPE